MQVYRAGTAEAFIIWDGQHFPPLFFSITHSHSLLSFPLPSWSETADVLSIFVRSASAVTRSKKVQLSPIHYTRFPMSLR